MPVDVVVDERSAAIRLRGGKYGRCTVTYEIGVVKAAGYGRSMSITIAAEIGAFRRLKIRLTPSS